MLKTSIERYALLCALLVLGLNMFRLASTLKLRTKINSNPSAYDINGNLRELPLSVTNAVMFFNNDSFLDVHAADTWYSAIPPGNGWVMLGPNKTAYAVSMYHQLHCINSMRYDLIVARTGKKPSRNALNHASHCYNYIRQGLLCKADVTLEPTVIRLIGGRKGAAALGNGVAHVCKDWSQVRRFMEGNYQRNSDIWVREHIPI